ncbi:PREDICTED: DNA replication complex GINS protein PSF3-like [Amphimedon queenslandica]|uniref:DNA replication complex GINS protein PSF3 n=1 Tax=Amphimedon queenslandica TaxID=400682 RepID=A0A1X7VM15_AMPQE|nr:PREDICTED: DNA replication complex GINS protein PSF3-like [Amphimedon queenslandica]|eukprot:XP_003383803.1 PREDICTED: DNA replication complex GINS protein PSF3-like [Amphimedon queenslandica]
MSGTSSQTLSFTKPSPSLPAGTGEDYWSLDDFISSKERIPSMVEENISFQRLGHICPHTREAHLLSKTKLDLPLWLAKSLNRKEMISITFPKAYKESMRTALSADPTVIDLHRNGPYFYSVGLSLLQFKLDKDRDKDEEEKERLAKTLIETFVRRLRVIMDSSHNYYCANTTNMTNQLDELEKYLFSLGQEALTKQIQYERGHNKIIMASSLTSNSRKRKRN